MDKGFSSFGIFLLEPSMWQVDGERTLGWLEMMEKSLFCALVVSKTGVGFVFGENKMYQFFSKKDKLLLVFV